MYVSILISPAILGQASWNYFTAWNYLSLSNYFFVTNYFARTSERLKRSIMFLISLHLFQTVSIFSFWNNASLLKTELDMITLI